MESTNYSQKSSLKNSIIFKVTIIFIISLLLLVPTRMIMFLITEREATNHQAISEVSSKWGSQQTIQGPMITIPYYRNILRKPIRKDEDNAFIKEKHFLHILPSELNISGVINPEKRYRGIYEVVVYNSKLEITGSFKNLSNALVEIPKEDLMLNETEFVIGIDDLRGIKEQVKLSWNDSISFFNPGISSADIVKSGIKANIKIDDLDSSVYNFKITLDLKGSQLLYFTPVGLETNVNITSNWSNPSFNGAFLPDSKEISNNNFKAKWKVLHLNRNFPQFWYDDQYKIKESEFGIDLILPVDNYQKSYRAIQYAILFIAFTFIAFFFIEVLNKIFIHPIQYILVGFALVIFYTLLISISEHISFNNAYYISSGSVIFLVAAYVRAILKSTKLSIFISSLLLLLYTFMFVIIQLQDFALLIGSIGLFVILSFVMYFSRKIDWYALNLNDNKK